MIKVSIKVVVWGMEFCKAFTEFCLPSMLADGNIGSPDLDFKYNMEIYTPKADQEWIEKQDSFIETSKRIQVSMFNIGLPPEGVRKHTHMNDIHRLMIQRAIDYKEAIILLLPDQVFTINTLVNIENHVCNGQWVVMIPGFRTSYQGIKEKKYLLKHHGHFTIEEAIDAFVNCMHPMSQGCFWNSKHFTTLPTNIYYWEKGKTITVHAAHLHPFFILNPFPALNTSTVDGPYMSKYNELKDCIVIPEDIVQLSLTEDTKANHWANKTGLFPLDKRQESVSRFISGQQPIHKFFLRHKLTFSGKSFRPDTIEEKIKIQRGISFQSFEKLL